MTSRKTAAQPQAKEERKAEDISMGLKLSPQVFYWMSENRRARELGKSSLWRLSFVEIYELAKIYVSDTAMLTMDIKSSTIQGSLTPRGVFKTSAAFSLHHGA